MYFVVFTFIYGLTFGLEYYTDPDGDLTIELSLGLIRIIFTKAHQIMEEVDNGEKTNP